MDETEKKHRRRRKSTRHQTSWFAEFRFELIIAVLFLFGAFLLFEDMEVKTIVFQGTLSLIHSFNQGVNEILGKILGITDYVETSDIVGSLFIFLAIFLLLYRARQKALIRYGELHTCPHCDRDLIHIHRTPVQRFISKVFRVKIRRMKCKECDYEGLRIRSLNSR